MAHLRAVPDPDDDPEDVAEVDRRRAGRPGGRGLGRRGRPARRDADEGDVVDEEQPRRYPSTIGGAFYLSILAVAGTALFIAGQSDWRLGIQILGGSLLVAALLRLMLANRDAGMLAVRNRFLDAFLLIAAGIALIALALVDPRHAGLSYGPVHRASAAGSHAPSGSVTQDSRRARSPMTASSAASSGGLASRRCTIAHG